MAEKDFKEVHRIGKKIGLETLGDYRVFEKNEKRENETLLEALKRYEKEKVDELGK